MKRQEHFDIIITGLLWWQYQEEDTFILALSFATVVCKTCLSYRFSWFDHFLKLSFSGLLRWRLHVKFEGKKIITVLVNSAISDNSLSSGEKTNWNMKNDLCPNTRLHAHTTHTPTNTCQLTAAHMFRRRLMQGGAREKGWTRVNQGLAKMTPPSS